VSTDLRSQHLAAMTAYEVVTQTYDFVGWINSLPRGRNGERVPEGYHYGIDEGQRYLKIWHTYNGTGKSVHAFVDKRTGDLLKAAGWKAPAKGARGNVLGDRLDEVKARFDWSGGYLYIR
jgi:hypothetical protein